MTRAAKALPNWRRLSVGAYASKLPHQFIGTRDCMKGRTFKVVGVAAADPSLIVIEEDCGGRHGFRPAEIDYYFGRATSKRRPKR